MQGRVWCVTTALRACNSPNVNWHQVVLQVSDFGLSRTVEQEAVNTVSCGCSELRTGPLVAPWLGSELAARVFWQQGARSPSLWAAPCSGRAVCATQLRLRCSHPRWSMPACTT